MDHALKGFFKNRKVGTNGNSSVSGRHMASIESYYKQKFTERGFSVKLHSNIKTHFTAKKNWDIVVSKGPQTIAVELKSINALSQAKNMKNRITEAVGTLYDTKLSNSTHKFGYVMIIEECPTTPRFITQLERLKEIYDYVDIVVIDENDCIQRKEERNIVNFI
jgi:hypothetical protein